MSDVLTPEQLDEMLCLHELDLWHKRFRTLIAVRHRDGPTYGPLIAGEMVRWTPRNKRGGIPRLTTLGEHVLFCRLRRDLERAGALPVAREAA